MRVIKVESIDSEIQITLENETIPEEVLPVENILPADGPYYQSQMIDGLNCENDNIGCH